MIKVINSDNINRNAHYIASFAMLRHRVFVEKLRWDLPSQDGSIGYEYDKYDTDDATYILVCNGLNVVAGVRLLKTTKRFLLGELYAHLESSAVPTGDDVLEITRFVVEPDRTRLGSITDPVCELVVALLEYGVANSLRNFISVSYAGMERILARTGCQIGRLGAPLRFDGRTTLPLKFFISEEILSTAKACKAGLSVVPSAGSPAGQVNKAVAAPTNSRPTQQTEVVAMAA